MKKIDLGQTIGIVANLGVISGIVFLAFEIRQSNIQARAAAYQAIGIATASVFSTWSADAEGIASSLIPAEQRTPEDWLRDSLLDSAFARLGETILLQVDQGLLPEDAIQRLGYQVWTTRLQTPEGVCMWANVKQGVSEAFREYVEGSQTPISVDCGQYDLPPNWPLPE